MLTVLATAAAEVIIYPGEVERPDEAVHYITRVAPAHAERRANSRAYAQSLDSHESSAYYAYRDVRSLPWFGRSWTVQEASVNPNTSLLIGKTKLHWEEFMVAMKPVTVLDFAVAPPDLTGIRTLQLLHRTRQHQLQGGGIDASQTLETLKEARILGAANPSDKVFAFRGLFKPFSADIWLPAPNYHRSVEDIYTSVAVSIAMQGNGVSLLPLAGTSLRSLSRAMPSWVPDWTFGSPVRSSLRQHRRVNNREHPFSAGSSVPARVLPRVALMQDVSQEDVNTVAAWLSNSDPEKHDQVSPAIALTINKLLAEGCVLVVRAAIVDEITNLTPLRLYEKELASAEQLEHGIEPVETVLPTIYEEACGMAADLTPDRNVDLKAVAITLVADCWREHTAYDIVELSKEWAAMMRSLDGTQASEPPNPEAPMFEYGGCVRPTLQERVFGVTKHGLMGVFPSTTAIGDQVAIVAGLELPHILSKAPGGFQVVGEAYVHGIMFGELISGADFQDLPLV